MGSLGPVKTWTSTQTRTQAVIPYSCWQNLEQNPFFCHHISILTLIFRVKMVIFCFGMCWLNGDFYVMVMWSSRSSRSSARKVVRQPPTTSFQHLPKAGSLDGPPGYPLAVVDLSFSLAPGTVIGLEMVGDGGWMGLAYTEALLVVSCSASTMINEKFDFLQVNKPPRLVSTCKSR